MDYKASENVSWPSICLSACVAVCHVHVRVLLTVYRVRAHARICCVCVRGCMRAHQFGTVCVPVQSLEGAYRLRVRPDICCARSNPLAVVFFSRRQLHVMLRCPRSHDDDVTDLQAAGGLRSVRKENEQVGIRIKNVQRHAVPLLRTQHGPRPVVAKRVLCTPVQRPGLAPRATKRC